MVPQYYILSLYVYDLQRYCQLINISHYASCFCCVFNLKYKIGNKNFAKCGVSPACALSQKSSPEKLTILTKQS